MYPGSPINLYRPAKHGRHLSALAIAIVILAAALISCGENEVASIQQSNTYPLEFFSEMHYSPAHKAQEPDSLLIPAEAIPFEFDTARTEQTVVNVPDTKELPYNAQDAANLYRINCSICHGQSGLGDGPAAQHLTNSNNIYAAQYGVNYKGPANLIDVRNRYTADTEVGKTYLVTTVSDGICSSTTSESGECVQVMPGFGTTLKEEDIRAISNFVLDAQTGLGTR